MRQLQPKQDKVSAIPYAAWRIYQARKTSQAVESAKNEILRRSAPSSPVLEAELHKAVREMIVDRFVKQGDFVKPYNTWAKELDFGRHAALKRDPFVLELLMQRLAISFVDQYKEFSTGEQKSTEDKITGISTSVMSLVGGENSPFERRRSSIVKQLNTDLDEVHSPAIAKETAAIQQTRKGAERLVAAEHIRLLASNMDGCGLLAADIGAPMGTMAGGEHLEVLSGASEAKFKLCFRPFRRYRMGTGILCQAGEALGNTFRGHEDFQMTDNIIAKTHIGHYTMWHKAVVVDDRRLYLAEDMFCSGYVGGEGHKSVDITTVLAQEDKFLEDPIQWMEQSDGGNGASIITIDVSFPEKTTMSSMPRSFYLENFSKQLQDLGGKCMKVATVLMVDELFQKLNSPEDEAAKENYLTDMGGINTVCFRTMEISTDRADGKQSIRTLNQGHFGVNGTYEGARRPRSGYIETFKDCKYEQHLLKNH